MSLSYKPLNPVAVMDPITNVNSVINYAILKGGNKVSWQVYTTNSVSQSSITWTANPPNCSFIVDRKQYANIAVRLTLSGLVRTTNAAYAPPTSLLNAGLDAPRQLPVLGAMNTMIVKINNDTVSLEVSKVIHALFHYNIDQKLRTRDYSTTPNYPDQSFNYSDLYGSVRSPLAGYGDGLNGNNEQRGSFPYTIVSNPTVIPTLAGTPATSVVDFCDCFALFGLSPFTWGNGEQPGFVNVNSMNFTFNFLSQGGMRMWSHDARTPVVSNGTDSVFSTINGSGMQFNQFSSPPFSYDTSEPELMFKYIEPNQLQTGIGPLISTTYPYFEVRCDEKDVGTFSYAGGQKIITSNSLYVSPIPRRVYIYVRPSMNELLATPHLTDTYMAIKNVTMKFAGQNTVLSTASQRQLYLINVKNHGDFSWSQWSGLPINNSAFPPSTSAQPYGGTGAVQCFEFGTDVQLNADQAPGLNGQWNMEFSITVQNMDRTGAHDNVQMTLCVVNVLEGSFTVAQCGASCHQTGVLTRSDIINSTTNPNITYRDVEDVNGGNFLTGLKDFGTKIDNFFQKSKLASNLASLIPIVGPAIQNSVANLGYGNGGDCDGGVALGGKRVNKSKLKRNLKDR
jgi:hypothetical protein